MLQYNCLIVEDEPLAAEILQDYIKQVPFLQLKGICADAIFAIEVLKKEKIDLIFLDIHLPRLKGLDFIKTLKKPPHIIITSAYDQYALQGYEYNVLDYLLKPVEFSRFLMAVNKISNETATALAPAGNMENNPGEFLFLNVGKKKVRVKLSEILYIESLKEYIRITTKSRSIITKFQLGQMGELLPGNNFLRVHRSYIVAMDKIDAFTATDVEINAKLIPIGRGYREVIQSVLNKKSAS